MKCPKCGSENVNVQMVTESKLKKTSQYFILASYWLMA